MGVQAVVRSFYYHANYLAVTKPSSTFLKPKQEINLPDGNETHVEPIRVRKMSRVSSAQQTSWSGEREGEIHTFSAAGEECISR